MASTGIVPLPRSSCGKTKTKNNQTIYLFYPHKETKISLIGFRNWLFCLVHRTALKVAAADVLQLHLNAEWKETRPHRKCPTTGSPSRRGPAQREVMWEERRKWAPPSLRFSVFFFLSKKIFFKLSKKLTFIFLIKFKFEKVAYC